MKSGANTFSLTSYVDSEQLCSWSTRVNLTMTTQFGQCVTLNLGPDIEMSHAGVDGSFSISFKLVRITYFLFETLVSQLACMGFILVYCLSRLHRRLRAFLENVECSQSEKLRFKIPLNSSCEWKYGIIGQNHLLRPRGTAPIRVLLVPSGSLHVHLLHYET